MHCTLDILLKFIQGCSKWLIVALLIAASVVITMDGYSLAMKNSKNLTPIDGMEQDNESIVASRTGEIYGV